MPTPHPAKGASEAAVKLYPDLAKEDSNFHRAFIEIYEQHLQSNPASLAKVDWPLDVARETAAMLDVKPASPTPPPRPATPTPMPSRPPNSLERGAYNEKRGVARPAVIYDRYGNRIR